MKKLNKKQRREIYLKVAEKMMVKNNWWGLCYSLQEHINKNKEPDTNQIMELFPEFVLFKPEGNEWGNAWWYNGINWDEAFYPRLDCMLLCAEMCKP